MVSIKQSIDPLLPHFRFVGLFGPKHERYASLEKLQLACEQAIMARAKPQPLLC